ncbi:phospholipase D [Dacryopinax primogenitus]|uniref:Phospholipase n=1 Tax=Dacryopinax primogenitus (strain DJM 731) TaxID=1858805 RepID=M5FQE7_DACPD|nr:phospholipase D [Dacryopinax primogenitus]EJT97673.1 phospholipase D [Dacryopinax primogenitus]
MSDTETDHSHKHGHSHFRQRLEHDLGQARLRTANKVNIVSKIAHHAIQEIKGKWNPNHRHDEDWEKEDDRIRDEIRAQHRFRSFAVDRWHNSVKWHIDGHDYFYALSELLDSARSHIFILDWWLSPELYLRRPPAAHPEWRLDRLLARKAAEGVRIYVVVYKEVTQTMSMSSSHTKHALEDLHENIAVMRHPDHIGTVDDIEFWSHHEKVVVVDNLRAAVGGLDACFGRWDTHNHPMADIHPTASAHTLFPGQDYNNARILDFQSVQQYTSNFVSLLTTPRMPWHDVHLTFSGPAVLDVVQHFVERWNEIRHRKYHHDHRYDILAFPHTPEDGPNEPIVRHPHREAFHELGRKFKQRWLGPEAPPDNVDGHSPVGTCRMQVGRSVSDWSHGVLTEHSIQNAYIQLIQEANHFIYIENQFFVSNTVEEGPVQNQIARALVDRIVLAAKAGRKFKVMVVIPELPGFSGNINEQSALKNILGATYRTINRGGHSIYEEIRKAGYDPMEYIRFYHLRGYDRIAAPKSFLQEMEQKSGVTFREAQAALARIWTGDSHPPELSNVTIAVPKADTGDTANLGTTQQNVEPVQVKAPKTVEEAREILKKFESAARMPLETVVSDSVAQHALQDRTELKDEKWLGTEEEEKSCYVTEEVYIHSKLMIVDDVRVIIGSANFNDRSQRGDGDSEIAVIVEDTDMFKSTMDGHPHMVARFATTLRRKLFREHLGLIRPQNCPPEGDEPVTSFMRPAPIPLENELGQPEDDLVADPLSDAFQHLWTNTAKINRGVFTEIFRTVPSDMVRNWEAYKTFVPQTLPGHVAPDVTLEQLKTRLSQVRGHVVDCPLDFLIEESELISGSQWSSYNPLMALYL